MILPVEEYGRSIHTALRDVHWNSGNDRARTTGHGAAWAWTMPAAWSVACEWSAGNHLESF